MKLFLLRAKRGHPTWEPWYDKAFGFVVRATDENEARLLASDNAGDEGQDAWIDANASTCVELTADGPSEMILQDFARA